MRPGLRLAVLAAPFALVCLALANRAPAQSDDSAEEIHALARSDYVENCGGCHGIQGTSAPAKIPVLLDRVGYFMCTPEARAYLIRLPNVAHSRLTDNAQLAELLNFVVFDLGGASTPRGSARFTGEEVARERPHVMSAESLKAIRARMVEQVIRACKAPASLRLFYPGQKPGDGS